MMSPFKSRKAISSAFSDRTAPGKPPRSRCSRACLHPTAGAASVLGFVPWERKDAMKRQISLLMGQKNALWWDLPARESLELNRVIYEIPEPDFEQIVGEFTEMLDVREQLDVMVRELSLGQRMKMELIAALLHRPKVLFLDEPTIGLDVVSQKTVREFLKRHNDAKPHNDPADQPLHAGHRGALRAGDPHRPWARHV